MAYYVDLEQLPMETFMGFLRFLLLSVLFISTKCFSMVQLLGLQLLY